MARNKFRITGVKADMCECCLCGGDGKEADMVRVTVERDAIPDNYQQFWAHPGCLQDAMHPELRALTQQEKVAAIWKVQQHE